MKVAIVGNGYVLAQSRKGQEIDSHDVVIRVSPTVYDEDISGVKTDIISVTAPHIDKFNDNKSKLWVHVGEPLFGNADKYIKQYGYGHEYMGVNMELESAIRIVSRLRPTDPSAPTTGMRTVFSAMEKFPGAQINLYGFDFYSQKYYYWYECAQTNPGKDHHPKSEEIIVKKLVRDGKVNLVNDIRVANPELVKTEVVEPVKETIKIKPEMPEKIHPDIIPREKKSVGKKGK